MSDDDMIRRGDALRVADEVFDQCQNVHGDDRGAFAAAEVGARIAALAPTDAATQKGGDAHDRRLRSHEASPGVTAGADAAQAREAALRQAAAVADEHTFGGPAVRDAILALIEKRATDDL